jgi:AcrR family transcriptional regulator
MSSALPAPRTRRKHATPAGAAGSGRGDESSGSDKGALTREQLIAHATRIFAAKGYAGATTREICAAAGANIASIHYYFGDKEGLYRAVLTRPIRAMSDELGRFDDPALPFEQAMRQFLTPLVRMALDEDEQDLQVTRLHLRELLEPSAVFREVVAQHIAPLHAVLAALLARHCGLRKPDAQIHQLAFAVGALANDYCLSREFMRLLAPGILQGLRARERIVDRLVDYSVALLQREQLRRPAPIPDIANAKTPSKKRDRV